MSSSRFRRVVSCLNRCLRRAMPLLGGRMQGLLVPGFQIQAQEFSGSSSPPASYQRLTYSGLFWVIRHPTR